MAEQLQEKITCQNCTKELGERYYYHDPRMINNNGNGERSFIRSMRENWGIILAITAIIFGWSNFRTSIAANTIDIGRLDNKQEVILDTVNKTQASVIELQTSIAFILQEIRNE